MPTARAKRFREIVQDFSGGINSRLAPNRIGPNESPGSTNVWYDKGALGQRNGTTQTVCNPTTGATSFYSFFSNLYRLVNPQNSTEMLWAYGSIGNSAVATEGGTGFGTFSVTTDGTSPRATVTRPSGGTASISSGGNTVSGSGTTFTSSSVGDIFIMGNHMGIITTITSDTALTCSGVTWTATVNNTAYVIVPRVGLGDADYSPVVVSMNSKIYATTISTTGNAIKWDGTTATNVATFPRAFCGLIYSNYVFTGNTTANPSRVSWSALKDPETWPSSNFIDLNPDDGQGIVGMFVDGQNIVVLKKTSAWRITGNVFDPANPTFSVTQIYTPPDFQVNSAKSVQFYGGAYLILGRFGFYVYNGSSAISKLKQSDNILSYMTNTGYSLGPSPTTTYFEPSSLIVNGKYWVLYPFVASSTAKRSALVYDGVGFDYFQWPSNGTPNDINYLSGTLYGCQTFQGAGGLGTDGGILNMDTGNTDPASNAIGGSYTTKVFEYPEKNLFQYAYLHFKKQSAGNITFGYRFNDASSFTTTTVDMTTGTGGTRLISPMIVLGQFGDTIQFQFSNSTSGQTFEIYAIEFYRCPMKQ